MHPKFICLINLFVIMVNKLLATVFEHIKDVDSILNVSIAPNYLATAVKEADVSRLVSLGNVLGLNVVVSPSYSSEYILVTFNI